MAPCERYSYEECAAIHGLEIGPGATADQLSNAKLLCGEKVPLVSEIVNVAAAAATIYLITNVYIQIAESSVLLKSSRIWGTGKPHEAEGKKAIARATMIHCSLGTLLYVGTIVLIRILTHPLDNRTNSVVIGLSKIFASVVFFMMSVSVPQWFGVYHSNKIAMVSFTSSREIRFTLGWKIWKQMVSMYFFIAYFSCADVGFSVLYGVLIGGLTGNICVFIAMQARSKRFAAWKRPLAILVIVVFAAGSWYTLADGIFYIANVWMPDKEDVVVEVALSASLVWVVLMVTFHVAMYGWTKSNKKNAISSRFTSQVFSRGNVGDLIDTIRSKNSNGSEGDDDGDDEEANDGAVREQPVAKDGVQANDKDDRRVGFAEDTKPPGPDRNDSSGYVAPRDAPSCWKMFMTKVVEAFPFFCGCCLKKKYQAISTRRLDYKKDAGDRTRFARFLIHIKRFFWYLLSFAFLFFTIVNIGASYEQCAARNALNSTFELLYPPDYRNSTLCAWDKPGPNATIKTFDSLQDVRDENYDVIHCGACGACSNWNDITLQYTSRKYLAGVSKVCAKKSIFTRFNPNDPDDVVVQCNHQRIGFTMNCSQAWAWDEVHTKNRAVFTFLQANIANAFADMDVTYQDITMATIDEALSGPRFVPWVGATRRRMNIKSDIDRPTNQQCTTVTQNWTEVFTKPFRPPVGGTYTIQPPGKPAETVVIVGQNDSP